MSSDNLFRNRLVRHNLGHLLVNYIAPWQYSARIKD
jgi:hypothetical protein